MLNLPDSPMLRAFAGLEGGLVASGSTCGVVTGAAMGLALRYADDPSTHSPQSEAATLEIVKDFVAWFEAEYGSSLCRRRSKVDFHTAGGQLRYFFPGDRVYGCMRHIRGTARYLHHHINREPSASTFSGDDFPEIPVHCARQVLKNIRRQTGCGDKRLEEKSFVFDGGVGLSGGLCGALAGAVMGINLLLAEDVRRVSYLKILRGFMLGHINLLLEKPLAPAREPFAVGRNVLRRFREEAGEVECARICGKNFVDYRDFAVHMASSEKCPGLIDKATAIAVAEIDKIKAL